MIRVNGKPFPRAFEGVRSVHRHEADFPERYVVCGIVTGWNECERCAREHRIWMCDDRVWRRLPLRLRGKRLCVGCFRDLVRGRP